MEKVYKSMLGWKPEDEKHAATHRILTEEEYQELLDQKARAEAGKREAEQQAERYKLKVDREARESIAAIQSDLNDANYEIQRLNDLNANLLRISRERANAKRGLKPKKEHEGYLVLSSQQFVYRRKPCWKTVVQTPYHASLPIDSIMPQLTDDLMNSYGARLGLKTAVPRFEDMGKATDNTLFSKNYKANYKSGFWEVEYLHTHAIAVPEDMRKE